MRDLVETVLNTYLENQFWVAEVCASGHGDDEVIKKVFKLRTLATNYLQGCPYALIDSVYFRKVFQNLPKLTEVN